KASDSGNRANDPRLLRLLSPGAGRSIWDVFGVGYEVCYEIEKGSPAPDVNLIKAFVRWYMLSARGRARTGVLPSMSRVLWIKNDLDSLISEAAEEAHVLNALLLVSLK
ncbi:hypothetical protein VN97_g12642, partial [Penicillium thymicola]